MQNKLSPDQVDKNKLSLKRKNDISIRCDLDEDYQHTNKNKKIRILYDEEDQIIKKPIKIQNESNKDENKLIDKNSINSSPNDSNTNLQCANNRTNGIQYTIDQNEDCLKSDLKFDINITEKMKLDSEEIKDHHESINQNYLKFYLNQMNQSTDLIHNKNEIESSISKNLDQTERSQINEKIRLDNQLNYVQLLNYHHCLMQKSFELSNSSDSNLILDKNQLKTKLTNYSSLNDQQINHLNSQLINSPGFKQLIEKNRALRLNLAYQKLQAENPNFACLPLRTLRPCRRQRTTFTNEQTIKLEIEYRQNMYISRNKRFQLADLLDLSESQIKIWFQNRRAKDKRLERAILDQQLKQIWN